MKIITISMNVYFENANSYGFVRTPHVITFTPDMSKDTFKEIRKRCSEFRDTMKKRVKDTSSLSVSMCISTADTMLEQVTYRNIKLTNIRELKNERF